MDEKFNQIIKRARELGVVDSGTMLIFRDYILECQNRIKKNQEQIQRLMGQNDQLGLTQAILQPIVQKYIFMQEDNDKREREAQSRLQAQEEAKANITETSTESPVTPPPTSESPVQEAAAKPVRKKKI